MNNNQTPRNQRRWQETFDVDGHKITVIIKLRTSLGNRAGYSAEVRDNKGNELKIPAINRLFMEEAQEIAYVKFVRIIETNNLIKDLSHDDGCFFRTRSIAE